MTLDEALAELGIDRAAGDDGARRAYLRLLKTRKPETDPEGFMRLREAYELVKASPWYWRSAPEVVVVPVEPPRVELPVEASFPEDLADLGRLSRRQGPRSEPPPEEPPPAEAEERNEAPEAPEDEAPEDEAPEDDLPPRDEPAADGRSIDDLMRAGEYQKAAAAMSALYLAASKQLFGAPPPVREALRMMLTLHSKGELDAAAALKRSFVSWLAATGQEARVLRGESTVLWTLVRELDALPSSLPEPVRSAIARAALSGDLAHARGDLASFRVQRRSAALSAGGLLRRSAPTIAAALADTLDPPPPPVSPRYVEPQAQRSKSGWWMIMVVLMGLLRIFAAVGSSSSTPSYTPSYYPPQFNLPNLNYTVPLPNAMFDAGALIASRLDALRATAIAQAGVVEGKVSVEYPHLEKKAHEVTDALEHENCATAKVAAKVLADMGKRSPKKSQVDTLDTELSLLNIEVRNYCAELGDGGAKGLARDAGPGGGTKQQP